MATYAQQLRDPRWQKRRLEVLERDEWACTHCGDDESELHVHHLRYAAGKKPWDYGPEDLRTLCRGCHEEATRVTRSARDLLYDMLAQDAEAAYDLVSAANGLFMFNDAAAATFVEISNQFCWATMSGADQDALLAPIVRCLHEVSDIAVGIARGKD